MIVRGGVQDTGTAGLQDTGTLHIIPASSTTLPSASSTLTNESSGHIAIAGCIQQDLAAVGITMTIRACDWNVFPDDRKAGNYDVARNGWIADFNDPINMLEMWTTESGNNDVRFGR